jgi:hypothetical protein
MTTQAKPCFGYRAAYYINRDGGWSVACDALGRVIRCETQKLALSVARYRRRRLQPSRWGNPRASGRTLGSSVNAVGAILTRDPVWVQTRRQPFPRPSLGGRADFPM